MTTGRYILEGKKAVECKNLIKWAQWLEKSDRRVALDEQNGIRVSTVFLGLDHSFGDGKLQIFETMIFGGSHDEDCGRYATWAEATAGHRKMCKIAFNSKNK